MGSHPTFEPPDKSYFFSASYFKSFYCSGVFHFFLSTLSEMGIPPTPICSLPNHGSILPTSSIILHHVSLNKRFLGLGWKGFYSKLLSQFISLRKKKRKERKSRKSIMKKKKAGFLGSSVWKTSITTPQSLPLADKSDSEQCHQLAAGDSSASIWASAVTAGTELVPVVSEWAPGFLQDRDTQHNLQQMFSHCSQQAPLGQDPSEGAVCFAVLSRTNGLDLL